MKEAYYFPHDCNAHKDPKLLGLRLRCGMEGVGIYWTLIEILRDSPNYRYPYDLATLELGLSLAKPTLEATLKAGFELELFVQNDGFFSSPALTRRMSEMEARREMFREAGRRGGRKSSHPQATLKPPLRVPLSHPQARKRKEKKGNIQDLHLDLTIPEDLAGSAAEIKDWVEYKRQRGQTYKPKGLEALWRKLRAIPADLRREAVDRSMANNWAGIFEPVNNPGTLKQEAPHWSEAILTK